MLKCQYCGKEFEARVGSIKHGRKSCGCIRGRSGTHRLSKHRFYSTWKGMMRRCSDYQSEAYKNYGGRGITVCEEWIDTRTFIKWAEATHPNIEGYTLDRIDNDKGYSPENCRWATKQTQILNQRISGRNTSGFVGVYWSILKSRWISHITVKSKQRSIGTFKTIEEAVLARDNYITQNSLPHKLSTEYEVG